MAPGVRGRLHRLGCFRARRAPAAVRIAPGLRLHRWMNGPFQAFEP
ncbi:MAG: hypothetical protein HY082_05725 [Gammaproteobacteria bacterium]|nr:hypothetical protein [Gammaproteobacteria bacterium]